MNALKSLIRLFGTIGSPPIQRKSLLRRSLSCDLRLAIPEIHDDEVESLIKTVPAHYAGLSGLNCSVSTTFGVASATEDLTGGAYNPVSNTLQLRKSYSIANTAANTASGGGDEVFSFQTNVNGGASATINLNGMTNLLLQSNINIARIKAIQMRLLSTTDDNTIPTTGSSVSNAFLISNNVTLPADIFNVNGSGLTVALTVTSGAITGVAVGAGGTGYPVSSTFLVVPAQSGGSGGLILATTNASGVVTTVSVATGGTGYTAATVPAVVFGMQRINSGGAYMYFDPLGVGFTLISSTNYNIYVTNMSGTDVGTLELDVIAATT